MTDTPPTNVASNGSFSSSKAGSVQFSTPRTSIATPVQLQPPEPPSQNPMSGGFADAKIVTHCTKRCTFGRWKRRILCMNPNGDICYYNVDAVLRGTIPKHTIVRLSAGVPGEDPDPPTLANVHMLVIETSGSKRTHFLLSSYDELARWLNSSSSVQDKRPSLSPIPSEPSTPRDARVVISSGCGHTPPHVPVTPPTTTAAPPQLSLDNAAAPPPPPPPTVAFLRSINYPMPMAVQIEFGVSDGALHFKRSINRIIALNEITCVMERSLEPKEANTAAILTQTENFVLYFYDLTQRAELVLQLKRRMPPPALFLELSCECSAVLERDVDVDEMRSSFNQFGRDIAQVMELPFNFGLSAPYVVVETTSFLLQNACGAPGVFRTPGLSTSITALRNAIDSSQDITFSPSIPEDVHNATGLLKLYLRSLPTPLLNDEFFNVATEYIQSHAFTDLQRLVLTLQPAVVNCTVRYLFFLLHQLHLTTLSLKREQSMTAGTFATLFAVVITPAAFSEAAILNMRHYVGPIQFLIEHYEEIWNTGVQIDVVLEAELASRKMQRAHGGRPSFHPTPEKLPRG
eukprot:PhM_4_TR12626/c0_g1_i1/m.83671